MKHASFYHKDTGILNGVRYTSSIESDVVLNTPPDHIAIEGHHDHLRKRVDIETGEIVDHIPPQPSADHEWQEDSKEWRLKPEVLMAQQAHRTAIIMIRDLEQQIQPRLLREVCLGDPDALGKLRELDRKIAILREDIIK